VTEADKVARFEEVARLMPDDPVVRLGLGTAYLEAGRAADAVREFAEAVRLKPDYTAAHRGFGRALEAAGRLDEAKPAYERGIEVGRATGDLQAVKEMEVFLRRLERRQIKSD
jgi:predicted Zn-dependent protease